MPESPSYTTSLTVGPDVFSDVVSATGNGKVRESPSVPAAKTGSLTTRTDSDTSTLTMDPGHGLVTNDVVDVFWSGGSRRGMTATVTVNSVVVDGGSGDNLPAAATAVTVMKPVAVDFVVTGDNVIALGVSSPVPGYVVFVDSVPAEIAAATYRVTLAGGYGKAWASGNGITNPLASKTTTKVKFSHGSTAAQTMLAEAVYA